MNEPQPIDTRHIGSPPGAFAPVDTRTVDDPPPAPIDTEQLIETAIDDAGQHMLVSDAPIARAAELVLACQGPAIKAILEARVDQIHKRGHDREHDANQSIAHLPLLAKQSLSESLDVICRGDERQNLVVGRRRLARTAALLMAAIDRLDMIKPGENDRG